MIELALQLLRLLALATFHERFDTITRSWDRGDLFRLEKTAKFIAARARAARMEAEEDTREALAAEDTYEVILECYPYKQTATSKREALGHLRRFLKVHDDSPGRWAIHDPIDGRKKGHAEGVRPADALAAFMTDNGFATNVIDHFTIECANERFNNKDMYVVDTEDTDQPTYEVRIKVRKYHANAEPKRWFIYTPDGLGMGEYEGTTARLAVITMLKSAGYSAKESKHGRQVIVAADDIAHGWEVDNGTRTVSIEAYKPEEGNDQ